MKIKNQINKVNETPNTPTNNDRRKAITGIVVGGAAATFWHKPIIKTVMLPAHAQTSAAQNFYATVATASTVSVSANLILDVLIPSAHAQTRGLPLADLIFEVEAISQGGGVYQLKIAAEEIPDDKNRVSTRNFVYGWEGSITGLNTNSTFTATGCAQSEDVRITAIAGLNMTIQMSYFSSTIQLDLVDGSASLPSFPLPCTNS